MEMKQMSEDKIIELMNHSIFRRATMMHTILSGYLLFESVQTKKGCTNSNLTYNDAEYIADKYTEITGVEVTPSQFLHDKNKLANELIEDYQKLQTLLNAAFDNIMRPMVESFYKHLYFKRRLMMDRLQPILIGLTAFLNYASGIIDKAELKRNIIIFDLIKMKPIEIDSMYLRHNLMAIEDDFNDICIKRVSRDQKKSGIETDSNFTINISM